MSQVSIIDIVGNYPQIPTQFDANVGFAIPIANTLEILSAVVAAGSTPTETVGSGNTITTNIQISQAIAGSDALAIGLAAFDSSDFDVDANGFVTLLGGSGIEQIDGDTGSITGSTVTIYANNAANNSGSTVLFVNSGTTSTLNVSSGVSGSTHIGTFAGNLTNTGVNNTGVGFQALTALTTGSYNDALGRSAGASIQDGIANTAIGWNSLTVNTSGSYNTAIGMQAAQSVTGTGNIGIGYQAMFVGGTVSYSIALGYQAGYAMSSGSGNIGIGILTLNSLSSGSFNTVIGYQAGQALTGATSNCILIGNSVAGSNVDNETIIGSTQTSCTIAGIANVVTANSEMVTINTTTGQLGSTPISTNPIMSIRRTLTSQEIKNLHATPIEMVPAPGVDKINVVVSNIGRFEYGGSNTFTVVGQVIMLYYGTSQNITPLAAAPELGGTVDFYSMGAGVTTANFLASDIENAPLTAYVSSVTEISGNAADDNTLTVEIQYYVMDI